LWCQSAIFICCCKVQSATKGKIFIVAGGIGKCRLPRRRKRIHLEHIYLWYTKSCRRKHNLAHHGSHKNASSQANGGMQLLSQLQRPQTHISNINPPSQTQCAIFNTTYNPSAFRTGNSVLRQRLRGPSMAAYYPRRVARFADLQKAYPGFETYDDFEEDRIESVAITKSRGKGAPKKKRTAAGKWEIMSERGKMMVLMCVVCLQSQRSLARRRGKRRDQCQISCLAIYPTRPRARACKNIHRHMDSKSGAEEHWDFTKKEALYGVFWVLNHISGTERLALYKNFNFPNHRVLYGNSWELLKCRPILCKSCKSTINKNTSLREKHITTQRTKDIKQTLGLRTRL
jgi:small subunit ribosomal protein S33